MRPVKAVRRDERFLSVAHIDKLYLNLSEFCLKKHAHRDFNRPKCGCLNLSDT